MKQLILCLAVSLSASPAVAQWVGGAEGGDGFASAYLQRRFTQKIGPNREVLYWAGVSYLHYDLESGTERSVDSPGVNAGAMYRWVYPNAQVGIGAGYDVRWTDREFTDGSTFSETEHGPMALGEAAVRFNSRVFSSGYVSYADSNEWLASRANVMFELGSGLRVGPEVGWSGNDDLEIQELGGVIEIATGDQWLWLRAGTATEQEKGGLEQDRGYFSVGITRKF